MIFPTLALWSKHDPEDALGRIDRALNDRTHRLTAGLSVSPRFNKVRGALVVSQGHGKYLRIRHIVEASTTIPKILRDACREITSGNQRNCGQIALLASDLAEIQATVVEQLKCEAGKYVDRVLAVAVCDPGIWDTDFDGKITYTSFCDSTKLAEMCGVTVVDGFPSRDLSVEGRGKFIEALPYWIMFADRDQRVASQAINLVVVDGHVSTYALPASDGLDSDVPKIGMTHSIGIEFLNQLIQFCFPKNENLADMNRMYADGLQVPVLREQWDAIKAELADESDRSRSATLTNGLLESSKSYLRDHPDSFSSIVRTGIRLIVDQCINNSKGKGGISDGDSHEVLLACPAQFEAGLINQFAQLLPKTKIMTTRQRGIDHDDLESVAAALLGLFNIDQMPANIPWLTGASCQRILGRLTPGRPSNWRQLVRVMADFQPAPMKLKDAV